MKGIFTLLFIALSVFGSLQAQQANPALLEQSRVYSIDNQEISSPLSADGVEQLQIPVIELSRGSNPTSPLSPMAVPANDNCANAIPLTINGPCINGTNKESTVQVGENTGCQGAITKSVWYSFVATATSLYVEVERTASSGCYLSSAVWRGTCLPASLVACEDAAFGPNLNIHNLTGLTLGTTYYVQVSYTAGGPCGNNNQATTGADFCIKVGRPVNCGTCASPCGPICVFATTPTVAQVTSTCTQYQLQSRLNAGQIRSQCYTFTSVSPNFSLQMIINTVGCSGGNVITFDWQLYPSNCSGVIQSGNLTNLNAIGLTVGASYVLCYTWTAACQHNAVYPYMVASAPLPVSLMQFDGSSKKESIELNWITASEINNHYFAIERSEDGKTFSQLGMVPGAGNSDNLKYYAFTDFIPIEGTNYYRLTQYDYDNSSMQSKIIAVKHNNKFDVSIEKNPVSEELKIIIDAEQDVTTKISIINQFGKQIDVQNRRLTEGYNNVTLSTATLANGVYHLSIESNDKITWLKFLKAE